MAKCNLKMLLKYGNIFIGKGLKMKKESKALYFSILINLIVAFLKVCGGLIYGSYTLIADGYYSICDFVTDIIALISAKVSKRRANKKYPFGFGKIEYVSGMLIGFLILLVGCFTIFNSFQVKYIIPNLNIIYVIIYVIFLKTLSSNYLYQIGKKNRSQILISSAKESFIDVVSSTMVLLIILLGQFVPVVDLIGSLLISILILWEGLKIINDNIFALVGIDKNDKEIKTTIETIVNENKNFLYSDSFLIKSGSYYQATIEIAVDNDLKVKDLIKYENKIKNKLKKTKYHIKFVDFNFILK